MREFLEIMLRKQGHSVETAGGGIQALSKIDPNAEEYDLVLTDLKMPHVGGIKVLEHTKRTWPDTEVIVITAFSTTETAIEAMKLGAYDYLSKPFRVDEIKVVIEKCLEKRKLNIENHRLRGQLQERYSFDNIVGKSRAIRQVFHVIERIARTRASVLLSGETGTGKELVAKAIHFNSPRCNEAFVAVNCAAIPEPLLESEFFGHVKGSFTSAHADKKGFFEEAAGGTLFLDEVGEIPQSVQVKLLRALQERSVKPVGATREIPVDVRIIAATNRDLEVEAREGRFRQDLYYRLNVVQLRIPPLRERREDIPLITQHFMNRFAKDLGLELRGVEPAALDALMRYPFEGNVRELENIVERAVTFETSDTLRLESLPPHVVERRQTSVSLSGEVSVPPGGVDLEAILAALERQYLVCALQEAGGVRTEAAKLLKVSFRSIRYKLDKYGITDKDI